MTSKQLRLTCNSCSRVARKGRRHCRQCERDMRERNRDKYRARVIASGQTVRASLCSRCGTPGHNIRTCNQGR
jgi:hypothetical protein